MESVDNQILTKDTFSNIEKIFVNQPTLPELDEFIILLKEIWQSKFLTNNGKFHQQLESELANYLGVEYISLFANGTLALIAALQVLDIKGEVITTPYSFVATTHAIKWNGITPVFCDIDPNTCNIDPKKIEKLLTGNTSAILPVHVYGNPCDVEELQEIADAYGLKIIYDAAHAFGVKIKNESILNFGDLSVLSFHATKIYNTFEGGAIISHDPKIKKRIDYLKNFGFDGETTVVFTGINAKMNEMQAALGLLQLKDFEFHKSKRKFITKNYEEELKNINGLRFLSPQNFVSENFAYFPIFIEEKEFGKSRDEVYQTLKNNNIFARRYFYPLISHFPMYRNLETSDPNNLRYAEKISEEVICLPIFSDLSKTSQEKIIKTIIDLSKNQI
ncbi:MAG: DegT/DnrJ/EryC1/StrS family aminotransferase [Ignavibacteriae bacterium]|nr:DegT/DnrJ/EryC1/StrS family aminotransferase [Ignavibacteriota bacterium]